MRYRNFNEPPSRTHWLVFVVILEILLDRRFKG
jgi:hypothetical protein